MAQPRSKTFGDYGARFSASPSFSRNFRAFVRSNASVCGIFRPDTVQSRTTNAASLQFSRLLHETDARVFESAESALQVLRLADERFRGNDGDIIPPLTTPCNGDGESSRCWALNYQRRWNQLLNDRCIEIIELPENAFFFLTLGSNPEEFRSPGDIHTLVLCLWLFREHQCIRGANVTVCVVAPHNPSLFWRLLELSKHVTVIELRDVEQSVDSFSIRSLFRGSAEKLTELVLANFSLSEKDARELAVLLSRNKSLGRIALINLNVKEHSLDAIVARIKDHDQLEDVELTENRRSTASHTIAYLLQARVTKLRLNADCAWGAVSNLLARNATLTQLAIVSRSTFHSALGSLAHAVAASRTLECLELILDPSWAQADEIHSDWEDLVAIIAQCRALRKLRITLPSLGDAAVAAISGAIANNRTLHELCFDGCTIPCYSAVVMLEGLLSNWTLQLLSLMNIEGDDAEYEHLLLFMMKNSLCQRVSVRYEGCQAKLLEKAMRKDGIRFRTFNFFCKYAPEANVVFEALPYVKNSLTSLSIDSNEDLCDTGAESLAKLFSDSQILRNAELDFPAAPDTSLVLLQGIAQSRSLTSLTLIGWAIGGTDDAVPLAFEDLLRVNSSITELTLVQGGSGELDILRKHLAIGLMENRSLSELGILHGPDLCVLRDTAIMQSLRVNRTAASLSARLLLGATFSRGALHSLERVISCDAMIPILQSHLELSSDAINEKLSGVLARIRSEIASVEEPDEQRVSPSPPSQDKEIQRYELRNALLCEIGKYLSLSDASLRR
ncbi:hypothetical protein HPB50_010188 [Hyalomma asiaticum]|uniref:Uncharacterized protein n=1 Tax=Hyalomma asiaticum TaxID=266040 RepID=A0ACB7TE94_HYAAI|nr:hypothetical protein HPB50_010188 [Hyalomma asiaticum]